MHIQYEIQHSISNLTVKTLENEICLTCKIPVKQVTTSRGKAMQLRKNIFWKIGLKFWNPKFNLLGKTACFLIKNWILWIYEAHGVILEQVKVAEEDYNFIWTLKLCKILVPIQYTKYLHQKLFVIICIYCFPFLSIICIKYFLQQEHQIEQLVL